MKSPMYAVFFLAALAPAGAQLSPGTVTAGGGVSFSTSSQNSDGANQSASEGTSSELVLEPQIGYVIAENLTLGISPFISTSREESQYRPPVESEPPYLELPAPTSTTKRTGSGYGIGVFASYHYFLDPKIALVVQTDVSMGIKKETKEQYEVNNLSSTDNTDYTTIAASAAAGIAFFITNTIELDAAFDIVSFISESSINEYDPSRLPRHTESSRSSTTISLTPTTLRLSARYLFQ